MNKSLVSGVLIAVCLAQNTLADNKYEHEHKDDSEFSFALIGDTPYGDNQIAPFDNVIREINDDKSVKFVMHAGDIKSGGATCDDARFIARYNQYQKFKKAFIYTPGDNEWTDCHRTSNGQYNPLERLGFLRSLFFPNPEMSTGQKPVHVMSQSSVPGYEKYVENVLFEREGIIFSTLHVVGSNNDLRPWSGIDANDSYDNPRTDRIAEFEERQAAVLDWIDRSFDRADEEHAMGVFLMMQANPRFNLKSNEINRQGFNAIIERIRNRTLAFKKPVVLAHGDYHTYLIDKPLDPEDWSTLTSELLTNLTRVQTFGSPHVHWIKVHVQPESSSVFTFEQKIVKENIDLK